MSKAIPSIQKYMTPAPHSIGGDQTFHKADTMMRDLGIRHLPVLIGGQLKGIVTDRDVRFLQSFKGFDIKTTKIEDCSVTEVFTVSPSAPLDEVCAMMAENKYGCALVVDNQKLVGIFTWIDALRAMQEILNARFHK
jgi:acetoin utilization protein AcuB